MENHFIPYDLAVELIELGFSEECFGWFEGKPKKLNLTGKKRNPVHFKVPAPIFQQAFYFFRDNFNMHVRNASIGQGYIGHINKSNLITPEFISNVLESPREVEIQCIIKLIELAKKSNGKK